MPFRFEWDEQKERENIQKHGYSFQQAMEVFADPRVLHLEDPAHSSNEDRFYAVGIIQDRTVLTVRYTVRGTTIRIFGAAQWRKWRQYYEQNT